MSTQSEQQKVEAGDENVQTQSLIEAQKDLITAITKGLSMEMIIFALDNIVKAGGDLNFGVNKGNPLSYCCWSLDTLNPDLVVELIKRGADPNYRCTLDPNYRCALDSTPLMFLFNIGAVDLAKFLVENGADPFCVNSKGRDIMYWAEKSEVPEAIEYAKELLKGEAVQQIEESEQKVQTLSEENEQLHQTVAKLEDELVTANKSISNLQIANEALRSEQRKCFGTQSVYEQTTLDLTNRITELEKQLRESRRQFTEAHQKALKLDSVRAQLGQLFGKQ